MNKEKVPAISVYDFLDEVDKDIKRIGIKDDSYSPHREMYDTVLSEFGHPNHLGLVICSDLKRDSDGKLFEEICLSKATGKGDKKNYSTYLD